VDKITIHLPIGNITLVGENGFIVRIRFDDCSVIKTSVDDGFIVRITVDEILAVDTNFDNSSVAMTNTENSFADNVKCYGKDIFKAMSLRGKRPVFVTNSRTLYNELTCSCEIQGDCKAYMIKAAEEIIAYFNREIKQFTFPTRMTVPPFSQRVYECLRKVPYGRTVTYKELGILAGMDRGFRAIGQIMKRNPLPIVYPCHRVVSLSGIGGFSGGLDIKRFLLALEGNKEFSVKQDT